MGVVVFTGDSCNAASGYLYCSSSLSLLAGANMQKWGLVQSPSCDCVQRQTMNHIFDTCPLTQFEGGLNLLHKADDDTAVTAAHVK